MDFIGLLCLLMLRSITTFADTSTCVPQITQTCGLCVEISDGSHDCKLTRLSHKLSTWLSADITTITVDASVVAIDPGIFDRFHKLQKLCLAKNYIKRISSNIFMNLTKLEILDLGYNQIE